jgi:hypothetical protein
VGWTGGLSVPSYLPVRQAGHDRLTHRSLRRAGQAGDGRFASPAGIHRLAAPATRDGRLPVLDLAGRGTIPGPVAR